MIGYDRTNKHRGLKDALSNGYYPHIAFHDLKKFYVSDKLFGPFLRRIPNTKRPDFSSLLIKLGLPKAFDDMDLLQATGGRLATDTYEFVSPILINDGNFKLNFYIAGLRHYYSGAVHDLSFKNKLLLEKDPENKYDPFAVKIRLCDGVMLGFVPAFYSEFVTKVIDHQCRFQLEIDRLDSFAMPQLQVHVSFFGSLNKSSSEIENYYVGTTP
ncbi:HIRAN domain-containing protein [Sporolactobacillus nakayamae]|uniref:HIRAN domain-containing protein n=1 Tax=Sporolactobacillus nakayamae TaxID=269670 RepID=A0A1I2UPJ4_9BACL|nr:HIRAN domain-containing protein [Sporolactobacillus nakayamae]SFG78940.1 HIRAN domain-containing protein [Sporolactobacillus nakayamae]